MEHQYFYLFIIIFQATFLLFNDYCEVVNSKIVDYRIIIVRTVIKLICLFDHLQKYSEEEGEEEEEIMEWFEVC